MARHRNALPALSDGEVLKLAARLLLAHSKDAAVVIDPKVRSAAATRLYRLARRVPPWTDRRV